MANQGWDFTTSVYFAISSLSTAGLQGPNTGIHLVGKKQFFGRLQLAHARAKVALRITRQHSIQHLAVHGCFALRRVLAPLTEEHTST